jgi:nicotinamide mononucleotide adenylyltransferase
MENINTEQKAKRKRSHYISFCVTEQEREMIHRRMAQTGIKSLRAYMLKMGVDGRVIHVELESVREMVRLLSNATNNINQISKRANETNNIYAADLEELRRRYDELWTQTRTILRKLADL